MPKEIGKLLTNFEILEGGTPNFIPIKARGASGATDPRNETAFGGQMKTDYIYMRTTWEDEYSQYNKNSITNNFIKAWMKKATKWEKKKFLAGYGWQQENTGAWKLPIREGNKYFIILFFRGVLIFDESHWYGRSGQSFDIWSHEKHMLNVKTIWKNIDARWKKNYVEGVSQYAGGGFRPGDVTDALDEM
jgi:hypothetical protein